MVREMDMFEVMATLGQHRHPDWWPKPEDYEDDTKRPRGKRGPQLRSARGGKSGEPEVTERSRKLFDERRKRAAKGQPPPRPGPESQFGEAALRAAVQRFD